MAPSTEDTDRLAQEEVADLYVLQGQPGRALTLLAEVLARQPYRHDVRDRLESLEAACRQAETREHTRPIPVESLAGAHEEAGRPDKALELLTPLLDQRPDDSSLKAWVAMLERKVKAAAGALLALVVVGGICVPADSHAALSAIAALHHGDQAATQFAAAILSEELRARGHRTTAADGLRATGCANSDTACLNGVAIAAQADDLYLIDVRTGADRWTITVGRFTPAARTLERTVTTIEGAQDARSAGVRSRLLRFLRNPGTGLKHGALLVRTNPPGARVFIDGEEAGAAPLIVDDLYAGLHLVGARSANRTPGERTALVEGLGLKEVVVPLAPGVDGVAHPSVLTMLLSGLALAGAAGGAFVGNQASSTQLELDGLGRLHAGNVERGAKLSDRGNSQALTTTVLWGAAGAALVGAALSYWHDWESAYQPDAPAP